VLEINRNRFALTLGLNENQMDHQRRIQDHPSSRTILSQSYQIRTLKLKRQTLVSPPSPKKDRITPVVVYSYLPNHTNTLRKLNEKLQAPFQVKTKPAHTVHQN
jgi:hypothetical protein